jgi:hypothetical protein
MQLGVFPHSPAAADVPVREQYQRAIAVTVATDLARGLEHALELTGGEIFALAPGRVGGSARGDGRVGGRSRSRL